MRFPSLWFFSAIFLASCGPENVTTLEEFGTRDVTLPNGKHIRAEVVMTPADMARGMMFRDVLPQGRGMLFIHTQPGTYTYWMYQVKVPLDIIWMDSNHRIVEISANTPPCPTPTCPTYGGHEVSRFVLELNGGEAQRLGLKVGQVLTF